MQPAVLRNTCNLTEIVCIPTPPNTIMDTSDPLIGPAQQIFSLSRLGKLTNFLTAPSSAEEFEVSFKNVSILAIDDNEKFLNACARFLNHEGFKAVSTMNNGIDGVGAVAKDKPDVVLLDLNMPEFSGFDVLEDLRSRTLDPKVIILSAQNDAASGLRAANLGASDFITKGDFFETATLKIKNTIVYGRSLLHDENALRASLLSHLDLLEKIISNDEGQAESANKIEELRKSIQGNKYEKKDISSFVSSMREVGLGAGGNLAAEGIIEIISALAGLM